MTHRRTPASAGPNLAAARRRARSPTASPTRPGGPIHVLLTDREAEHIPGCNMAFRRDGARGDRRLRPAVPRRRRRRRRLLAAAGARAGRSASARRRSSGTTAATRCARYWRQQRGYGKAEALLERKWPEKYNAAGHVSWARPRLRQRRRAARSARGAGASTTAPGAAAPFQSLYQPADGRMLRARCR